MLVTRGDIGLVDRPKDNHLGNDQITRYDKGNGYEKKGENCTELAWMDFLVNQTPNGSIYLKNDFLNNIKKRQEIILVHITFSYEEIIKSGYLYPSVGCLGATIFSSPLTSDRKLSNLTKYFLQKKIPRIQKERSIKKNPSLIGIRIKDSTVASVNIQSNLFNYLLIGETQYNVYESMKCSYESDIDKGVFLKFEKEIYQEILDTKKFLDICNEYSLNTVSDDDFFKIFHHAQRKMSILNHVLFEVLSEYVLLHQTDIVSSHLLESGQLNNFNFKDLIYSLRPSLLKGFDLSKFDVSIEEIMDVIQLMDKSRNLFSKFDKSHFLDFMKWRIAQYVRLKILQEKYIDPGNMLDANRSVLGHVIHRRIGDLKFMDSYVYRYDSMRARTVWENWSKNNVQFVENAILPKGEVGINPLIKKNDYEIIQIECNNFDQGVELKSLGDEILIADTIISGVNLMGSQN